jgi:hypothetical protein
MLAEFDAGLEQHAALFYPRLSTGIGCFFDNAMHQVLGIRDHAWQSLYHFAVGGPVDDPRLQTLPSYWYLK